MANASIFSFCYIIILQLFKVQFVLSQAIHDDISRFQGPFTETLKGSVCTDSVKTCGIRLYLCESLRQLTSEKLSELKKDDLEDKNTVNLLKDKSRGCQHRLQELETNVSESLNAIDSLRKLNLNADLELQECQNKINMESNKVLAVNKSLNICKTKSDECALNLINTTFVLTTKNETLYRTIEKLEQKSLELNYERANVVALNNRLKRCNEVRMEVDANLTSSSEALERMKETIFSLENESMHCNLTLGDTLSNFSYISQALQASEKAKQSCLDRFEIQTEANVENVRTILSMNNSLLNCERSLNISGQNFSEYMLNMSLTEHRLLETIKSQLNKTKKLQNKIIEFEALNESLQKCDFNLRDTLRNITELELIISKMTRNWSTAISECSNETKILEERLQICETSLEMTTRKFSEVETHALQTNVSFSETLNQLQNKTEELENDLTEYKHKLEIIKSVPKRILSWTVDDLCRNIPNFVFEDKDLCPFFYDCSQTSSYLQQCPYPQLFSDINTRCEDPSTVSCGSRTKIYGYTCDFEILDDSNCFLVDSDSGTFTWTRKRGSTSSDGTGPSSAHHGRYYTYIETSSPRVLGDNAILESNKTFQDRTYCLNLFYHMRGSHIGKLMIKTKSSNGQTVLKQISGEQGNIWQRMDSLDVHLNEDTKILIEATRGSSYKGDISIDLVTLLPRKCTKSERQEMTTSERQEMTTRTTRNRWFISQY